MWGHPHVIPSPPSQSCFTSQLSFLCPYTHQNTDLANSILTTTGNHSLTLSFLVYFQTKNTVPGKRNYLLEATPISSVEQPMTEQADQQWPV